MASIHQDRFISNGPTTPPSTPLNNPVWNSSMVVPFFSPREPMTGSYRGVRNAPGRPVGDVLHFTNGVIGTRIKDGKELVDVRHRAANEDGALSMQAKIPVRWNCLIGNINNSSFIKNQSVTIFI